MLATLDDRLFLAINAPTHPSALTVAVAGPAASGLVYAAATLVPALWIWGRQGKRAGLLATVLGASVPVGINQVLGLLQPRPFMIGLGHRLAFHGVEISFPSDHPTFMWGLGFGLITTGAARRWGALVCLAGLLVAWARVYLGLHFPIDMTASFVVAIVGCGIARTVLAVAERWLLPIAHQIYEATLRGLCLPATLFPRGPER